MANLLVVDDEQGMRQLLSLVFGRAEHKVRAAENGRAALALLDESPPDLVLLDLMMPEMDGFEFITELRKRQEWRAIPIVVVTAKELTAEDHVRLNGCVERVLQKGAYSREELLAEVRDLVTACLRQPTAART